MGHQASHLDGPLPTPANPLLKILLLKLPLLWFLEQAGPNIPVALRASSLLPAVAHKTTSFSLEKAPLPEPSLDPFSIMGGQTDRLDSSPVSPWLCDSDE